MCALTFAALLLSISVAPPSLARQGEPPPSKTIGLIHLDKIPIVDLPAVDRENLLAADAKGTKMRPLRAALPIAVEITPQTHGRWEALDDGSRVWRLRFRAPGATDLNFGFTRYRLPVGARLYILSEGSDDFEGPYTATDNRPHFQLWTPMVPGGAAVAELFVPAGVDTDSVELELTRIGTGYRGM